MANDKRKRRKKIILQILILIIFLFLYFISLESEKNEGEVYDSQIQYQDGELKLIMIDVGQADCFLLMQDGKTALVDCGTCSTGKDAVKYLKELGIEKLDYVFGTHPHDDHMGGMYDVVTNFEIGTVLIPKVEVSKVTANWYIKLMEELMSSKYKVRYPQVGDVYELGNSTIKVIGPISKEHSNVNNYSTILKITFGEMDIIMTGDAEKDVEKEILDLGENIDAEILKVGHHGSDTSSSENFIDAISPDYALISTKVGNKYKHPIKITMDNLKKRNIVVYRTDENGSVIATITSNDVRFNSNPGDYLSGTELEGKE